jgi:hypothetical protein
MATKMTKKETPTDRPRIKPWPAAVAEATHELHIQLPEVVQRAMGNVLWRSAAGDRLVSFKRRLVAPSAAEAAGVEWALWLEQDDDPSPVLTFRESLHPTRERAEFIVSVLKGWLVDKWSDEIATMEIEKHIGMKLEPIQLPKPVKHQ